MLAPASVGGALDRLKVASIEAFERELAEPVVIALCSRWGKIDNLEELLQAPKNRGFNNVLEIK